MKKENWEVLEYQKDKLLQKLVSMYKIDTKGQRIIEKILELELLLEAECNK